MTIAELPETLLASEGLVRTIAESCEELRVGRSTLRTLISSGQLRAIKIGRAVRVPVHELRRFVAERMETSHA
jgi:excisionase family DNA binding protein